MWSVMIRDRYVFGFPLSSEVGPESTSGSRNEKFIVHDSGHVPQVLVLSPLK